MVEESKAFVSFSQDFNEVVEKKRVSKIGGGTKGHS